MRAIATAALVLLLPVGGLLAGPAKPLPTLRVGSADLPAGQPIPELFTGKDFGCTGAEVSPALSWSGAPAGTKSFVVTMYDPFRPPQSGWWHWVVVDIPAKANALARSAGNPGGALPAGAKMVRPDGDTPEPRYYGPCPDKDDPPHPYMITVYALDVEHLGLPDTATAADYDYAALAHLVAKGRIERSYQRR